jgi:hypothetical protein
VPRAGRPLYDRRGRRLPGIAEHRESLGARHPPTHRQAGPGVGTVAPAPGRVDVTSPATVTVVELAALLGVSPWTLYAAVKDGVSPVPPIRVGRRVVFALAGVAALLGVDDADLAGQLGGDGQPAAS